MYSKVVYVFLFYLTGLYGLNIELGSSDVVVQNGNATIANKSENAISSAAAIGNNSEVNTAQPENIEISNRNLNLQDVTDSSDIAPRIGLDIEPVPLADTFNAPNGFVPSFLKTFRRKRNLVVNEDESSY